MANKKVATYSTIGNNAPNGYLIAGIALQTPNQDPGAIPIPEAIKFLYNLPRRPIKELDSRDSACTICFEEFINDGPNHQVDIFKIKPEVPVVLPCNHILGSSCLWQQLSPTEKVRGNNCPLCRREFFANQTFLKNPAGIDRAIRMIDWTIQECRRRLVEGPEAGKADARAMMVSMERRRRRFEQRNVKMQTGRVENTTRGRARQLGTAGEEIQTSNEQRAALNADLRRLMEQGFEREAQELLVLNEQRARLDADLERVREQDVLARAADDQDIIAALREQRMGLEHASRRIADRESDVLWQLLIKLRPERAEQRSPHPS